jgi:uncharacterized membrane protein YcaP (DUF421 family)
MDDYSFDLQRIFFGNVPLLFLLEIALRTSILYLYLLALLRVSGKRSADKLTPIDVAIIISLGSAAGDPMFYIDIPVIYGMVVITVVVALRRLSIYLGEKHKKIEHIVQGVPFLLIKDGVMDRKMMDKGHILRDELFGRLREKGYRHLGQVKRLYAETDGEMSIFEFPEGEAHPGLPVEPPWEIEPPPILSSDDQVSSDGTLACHNCGALQQTSAGKKISHCQACGHYTKWVRPID